MPDTDTRVPPAVEWAQRKNGIFLTFCLEDCKNPEIKIDADKVFFKGVGGTEKKEHEVTMELYQEVVPEDCKYNVRDRNIEMFLKKKDTSAPFWPHLLKEKKKYHWIKVDFNKWRDEDDSDDDMGQDNDLQEMMRRMGGLGGDAGFGDMGGGMGGMGGMPGMGGMGMGGMPGMPGMGMGGMPGMSMGMPGMGEKPDLNDMSDEDSDGEDLPDLE